MRAFVVSSALLVAACQSELGFSQRAAVGAQALTAEHPS
jgi:hypothetical protein